jgi:DNA polymerase III subunit delta
VATAKKSSGYKIPNSKQILPSIEKGDIKPCYLFLGEETGEKDSSIEKISSLFFKGEEPLISRFHCSSGDITSAAANALESSMFSEKKITVILEIETLVSKRDTALLEDIVRDQPDNSIVILESTDNSIPKQLSACADSVHPVIFWRMFESEIQSHIIKRFSAAGRHIDAHAAARIVSLTGRDIHKANDAIDRIIAGSEGSVNEKTVVQLIADEREVTVFEFVDAFFRRKKDTLNLLKKVLDEGGNELGMIALLLREAERIESYHSLRLSGKNHEDAISELRINPRNLDDFSRLVQTISLKQIRNLFILLSRADRSAKSSRLSPSVLASPLADTIAVFFDTAK